MKLKLTLGANSFEADGDLVSPPVVKALELWFAAQPYNGDAAQLQEAAKKINAGATAVDAAEQKINAVG